MAPHMLLLGAILRLWGADAALWAQDRPTQIHINQGDRDGTAVTFSWMTESDASSTVLLGTQSGLYVDHVDPTPAARYSYTSPNGPYTSGLIHHVTVPHLTPSTKYFYRCGSHTGVLSAEHSFRTPPPPSAAAKVSFAIVGDLGQTKYSKQNMEDMLADAPEALVIVGDLSYADSGDESTDDRPCGQDRWDSWFQMMQPLFSNTLIMTLPGNHEMEIAGTQPQFLAYTSRLRMPSQQQLFYSYNYGSVHMVMLNSYMPFAHGTPQATTSSERTSRRWTGRSPRGWWLRAMPRGTTATGPTRTKRRRCSCGAPWRTSCTTTPSILCLPATSITTSAHTPCIAIARITGVRCTSPSGTGATARGSRRSGTAPRSGAPSGWTRSRTRRGCSATGR
jgi:hypothetical protein